MKTHQTEITQALLKINAITFRPRRPITFVSGIKSPVYIDNRKLIFHPQEWQTVTRGFQKLAKKINFDVIAGIETSGIPHSSILSFTLNKPSVFIRKKTKDHGTKIPIEGGKVKGKKVLLIEDHVSTGGSSLNGVKALRDSGATVDHCLAITSYEFQEAQKAFKKAQVKLITLVTFPIILREAYKLGKFTQKGKVLIQDWLTDPHGWAEKHGF